MLNRTVAGTFPFYLLLSKFLLTSTVYSELCQAPWGSKRKDRRRLATRLGRVLRRGSVYPAPRAGGRERSLRGARLLRLEV